MWPTWADLGPTWGSLGINGLLCGISGRPNSTNVLCPDKIGRDSWDRGGQESELICNSPQELGEEALTERTPKRKETERPHDKVIVVVVVVVVESYFF